MIYDLTWSKLNKLKKSKEYNASTKCRGNSLNGVVVGSRYKLLEGRLRSFNINNQLLKISVT